MENIRWNRCQTPLEELCCTVEDKVIRFQDTPKEVQENFWDFINNVPFIRWMISPDRPLVSELPRDEQGRAIIDVTKPPILEDTEFFRQMAFKWQEVRQYTSLRPNRNPQSDFGKWLLEERKRSWDGLLDPNTGMWITGDQYFFLNYCPIQLIRKDETGKNNRVIDFPDFWDGHFLIYHYLQKARQSGHHAAELASRGKGKAHPYNQTVMTPDGQKLWGDIKVGDLLYDERGGTTRVIAIPFDDVAPVYELTLADGRKVRCSEGHLWNVYWHGWSNNEIVTIDTAKVRDKYVTSRKICPRNPKGIEYHMSIPTCDEIEMPYREVPIDPYTLGVLLGDGSFRSQNAKNFVRLTKTVEDWEEMKDHIPYDWGRVNKGRDIIIRSEGIVAILQELGLWGKLSTEKHIPECYINNSIHVRKELLRGLMDTDGGMHEARIELDLSSYQLIQDIIRICQSLGYSYRLHSRVGKYKSNGEMHVCNTSYRLKIYTQKIRGYLSRKNAMLDARSKSNYANSKIRGIKIINVEYVGTERCKCVTVDNPTHLYLIGDYIVTHNSYCGAELLTKRFLFGESILVRKKVQCVVTAADRKYIYGANQILNMFCSNVDFIAANTQFPSSRLVDSAQSLTWVSGYKDKTGVRKGSGNSLMGITSGDDQSKLNGSRGVLYLIEEAGIFKNLMSLYQMIRPSVEDGTSVYGQIFAYGTSGDDMSDFTSLQEIMYNPRGYNMHPLPNVYDKEGQGRPEFTFFYPAYMNRSGCMDKDGNSDITKALLEILMDRYNVKYNSTDINAITKRVSQYPITPQEAIIRSHGSIFPVTELNERLNQIDNNPNEYDDVYVGNLMMNPKDGSVEFKPTSDQPIREFPTKDNKVVGAIEIYCMPQKGPDGKIPPGRYIAGADPFINDTANTMSLGSFLMLDTWTDTLVMEYTGRPMFADDYYEICRLACLFYNATVLFEANKKGYFPYFTQKNSSHLLADTPEYLLDKQLIKGLGYGNTRKGVTTTVPIKNYGFGLIRDWLLKSVVKIVKNEQGEDEEITISNLYNIRNRALLKELILYNPQINVDRIMALVMLMIYREEKMALFQGNLKQELQLSEMEAAEYWDKNYPGKKDVYGSKKFDSYSWDEGNF